MRLSIRMYQMPQGKGKFISQSESNCVVSYTNTRKVLQKVDLRTKTGSFAYHKGAQFFGSTLHISCHYR